MRASDPESMVFIGGEGGGGGRKYAVALVGINVGKEEKMSSGMLTKEWGAGKGGEWRTKEGMENSPLGPDFFYLWAGRVHCRHIW